METFAKNLDDAVGVIAKDGSKILGRSTRIKRRMDMILEEIQGVQMSLRLIACSCSLHRIELPLFGSF